MLVAVISTEQVRTDAARGGGESGVKERAICERANPHLFWSAKFDTPGAGKIMPESKIVRAMKAGAVEFLTKPFRDQDLLDAVQLALERDRDRLQRQAEILQPRTRLASLTLREREVLPLLVSGRSINR